MTATQGPTQGSRPELGTEEFVRHGGGLLVPAGVGGEQVAAAVLRDELAAVRELAVAQQAEHRAAMGTLVERIAAARVLPAGDDTAGDAAGDPDDAGEAARLRAELAAARDLVAVQAEDDWARRAQATEHRIAIADVAERADAAERARRERARDAAEVDALAVLYRRATRSGARARIRAEIQGSAEMRALRVAAVRKVALLAGLPVLAAFAVWSTTGVQAGVVRLLHLADDSAAWWASWAVEPALITIVALLIVGRAVLRSSGGDTDWRATLAEWSALGLSLALNIVGGWPGGGGFWAGLGTALPHAIGPLGCATTAFLIGLFDTYVSAARPWDNAPRLADLDLTTPASVSAAPLAAVPLRAVTDSTGQAQATQAGATHARAAQAGAIQSQAAQVGATHHRSAHAQTAQSGSTHGRSTHGRSTQAGATQRRMTVAARAGRRSVVSESTSTANPRSADSPVADSRAADSRALAAAYEALSRDLQRAPSGVELGRAAGVSKATANRWKAELDAGSPPGEQRVG